MPTPNKIQEWNGRVHETRVELHPGPDTEQFVFKFTSAAPAMLRVRATGLATALVEYTTSPSAMLADGTADFDPVPKLPDGVLSNGVYPDPIVAPLTAIRVTALQGLVTVEILQ